jgi:Phage integrase family
VSQAGLLDTGFPSLRHTCATLLLTRSVHPKIVSEMLGHSSVSITLDTYSHVIPGLGEVAANAMEEALGNDTGVGSVGDRKRSRSRNVLGVDCPMTCKADRAQSSTMGTFKEDS